MTEKNFDWHCPSNLRVPCERHRSEHRLLYHDGLSLKSLFSSSEDLKLCGWLITKMIRETHRSADFAMSDIERLYLRPIAKFRLRTPNAADNDINQPARSPRHVHFKSASRPQPTYIAVGPDLWQRRQQMDFAPVRLQQHFGNA